MPVASLPLKHAITLAIGLCSLFLSYDLVSFPMLFRFVGQLPYQYSPGTDFRFAIRSL